MKYNQKIENFSFDNDSLCTNYYHVIPHTHIPKDALSIFKTKAQISLMR